MKRQTKSERATRLAIVGVGQVQAGDDAVGTVIARTLRTFLALPEHILVIDAGAAPENYTGSLRRFQPDVVLLIDAAQMDAPCGAIHWIDWRSTTGISASSHTLPLHVFANYVNSQICGEIALLGIQPDDATPRSSLSSVVKQAARRLLQELAVNCINI
ncbi:MAG: hydrogenase maturation protease [Anaerolineae bacterium]|nr:hydrogenase maturation protease [Anaerolineae bacterium]